MTSRWVRLWDCSIEWHFGQTNSRSRRGRNKVLIGMFIYRLWDGVFRDNTMGYFQDMGIGDAFHF